MQLQDLLDELNRNIKDENNFTFTNDQKTDALKRAIQDGYAVTQAWDDSLTFSISQYQYPLPATISSLRAIYLSRDAAQFPEPISREMWEVVDGNLQFNNIAHWTIPDAHQLYLKGFYKVTVADTINDPQLQEYILSLAGWNLLKTLTYMKLGSFLRNDTQVGEILNARREMMNDVLMWRQQLNGVEFFPV